MAGMSPTQLTLRRLRRRSELPVEVTERWCNFSKRRKDLFNIIDALAIEEDIGSYKLVTVGYQITSYSNMAARRTKIEENEVVGFLLETGWRIRVEGWKKVDGKWLSRCQEADRDGVGGLDWKTLWNEVTT